MGTGRLVVAIQWPGRQPGVPTAAECVHVALIAGGQSVADQKIVRPSTGGATQTAFDSLPAGDLTLVAAAFPEQDGSGVAQAQGIAPVTIASGETASLTLSLNSTVDHLELYPQAPAVTVGQLDVLYTVARNAAGDIVLTWADHLRWTSANPALVTVGAPGVITGVAPTGAGAVTVTATDTESGKSASVPVTVASNATVAISPSAATISVSETQAFAATVANAPDTAVSWSVQEGDAGGSITDAGLYTAPAIRGVYHVVATSRYDGSKKATAAVTVQSGGAGVVVK